MEPLPFHAPAPSLIRRADDRKLLREILIDRRLTVGARVLDVGCGKGELTGLLEELAIDSVGMDERPDRVAVAARQQQDVHFVCGSVRDPLPFAEHSFDLVLARDLPEYGQNLFGEESLRATAHLAAAVRPGGELLILQRTSQDWNNYPGGHRSLCFAQHLGCFPGATRIHTISDRLLTAGTWGWMIGRQPRPGYLAASLVLPQTKLSFADWRACAETAARRLETECCEWETAMSPSTVPVPMRRAA